MDTSKLSKKTDEMLGGNLVMDWNLIQGGVVIVLVVTWYENLDKLGMGLLAQVWN